MPHDCDDGFLTTFWRRPAAYLDPVVRSGMSALGRPDITISMALARLADDFASGAWKERYGELCQVAALDIGCRHVIVYMGRAEAVTHVIRLARASDVPAIVDIVGAAYAHYVRRIGRQPSPMLDDYGALVLAKRVHVIGSGSAVLGFVVLQPEPHTMLLDNVAVAPAAQGMGLGRRLLAFADAVAREAGCRAIRLYTNEVMTESLSLYRRIGYVETHRGEEDGLRRVCMTKVLD